MMNTTNSKKNYVTKTGFRNWVKKMVEQFESNDNAGVYSKNDFTYVFLRGKVGISKCNSKDGWDNDIGLAYAWARCTGQPEYYINSYVLTPGDWVYIHTKNDKRTRYLIFISEGIDNYCFKMRNGNLTLIAKSNITNIEKE